MRFMVLMALALGGCASAPNYAELVSADKAACQNYGFKEDTPEMAQCLMEQAKIRREDQAERRRLAMQFLSTQRSSYTPAPYYVQQPKTTTCNSNAFGGSVTTTCY